MSTSKHQKHHKLKQKCHLSLSWYQSILNTYTHITYCPSEVFWFRCISLFTLTCLSHICMMHIYLAPHRGRARYCNAHVCLSVCVFVRVFAKFQSVISQPFLNRSRWNLVHTLVARRARSAISDCLVFNVMYLIIKTHILTPHVIFIMLLKPRQLQ